jgi:hypothetical protein
VRVLGFDWLFALLSPGTHAATVYLALRILNALLVQPSLLARFSDGAGSSNAGGGGLHIEYPQLQAMADGSRRPSRSCGIVRQSCSVCLSPSSHPFSFMFEASQSRRTRAAWGRK